MSSSFEKSVKGATKIKNAPPKTKYIEHILVATHSGEAGVGEVFRALTYRLRDSTWTVVFKSLITVHLMIREGSPDVTLAFLSTHRNVLAISSFTDAQIQGRNIRHYAHYLAERARAYEKTKTDWVRASESRLEKLSVEKGLLRETEIVQHQLEALLKCDVMENEPENEITITVFRLLVLDLLALFQVLNQGLISILGMFAPPPLSQPATLTNVPTPSGKFFEMSKVDAERAMAIYRKFTKQTDYVVQYLSVARQHEHHTRVEVPKLKHAPVNLGRQLEEYLHDPDFEVHRRQYLAEQDVKKIGGGSSSKQGGLSKKKSTDFPEPASNNPFPKITASSTGNRAPESKPQANKGPDPDLIDFFDSIEQNQTPMSMNPQPQQQAFQQQPTGMPFQQNGFAAQPTGFASNSPFQQPQQTGFMQPQQPQIQQPQIQLQPDFTGAGFGGFTPQQQAFQPSSLAPIPQDSMASFPNATPQIQQPVQNGSPQGLQPMQTGSTNPFRQSMLMAQQTGLPSSATTPALNRQSTNPFARTSPQQNTSPFAQASNSPFQSPSPQQQPALQPTPTGTNPFARNSTMPAPNQEQRPQTAGAALAPQPTGTTNPFRNGAFVNHNTGMGWQANQQPIGGGLDQLPTVPVFPRPAQQTPWQQ
ncbi:ENTH domain-containing [Fusarium acutatum]|uniref:ENTH domain-containing n=1 Tax=Fusarium acutatum TaxID=78861 RepID=A0A8H4JHX8_9HYPO|nr:ENTH domain-containing [Fusarium acutatum]